MNVRMTYSSCSRWCRSSLCKSRIPRSCRFQLENKMKVSFTVSASDKQSTTTMRRNVHTYSWSIHKGPCSQLMSLVFVWSCCVSGLSWVSVVWCSDKGQSFYSVLGTTGPGANCACHAAGLRVVHTTSWFTQERKQRDDSQACRLNVTYDPNSPQTTVNHE